MDLRDFNDLIRKLSPADFILRGTLVLILTIAICRLLRWAPASLRHRVWLLGLTGSVVVPIAAILLPTISVPLLPVVERSPAASDPAPVPELPIGAGHASDAATGPIISSRTVDPDAVNDSANVVIARPMDKKGNVATATPEVCLAAVWLLGLTLGLVVFVSVIVSQRARWRRLPVLEDGVWLEAVATAAAKLKLRPSVVTLVSARPCIPAAIGLWRPGLLVPADWRDWSTAQRDCILLHELSHIHRRDVAGQCVARLAMLVHWFNPLAWYAGRQLRAERELASDDCVLLTGCSASHYAEQLLATVRRYRFLRSPGGVAMANTACLDERIRSILDPRRRREPVNRWATCVTALLVAFACLLPGRVTLSATETPSPSTSATSVDAVWKETHAVRYPGTLPVSVAFSPDGKTLMSGDAQGEVKALDVSGDQAQYRWKSNVGGSHAAVAYSRDGDAVYATTSDGVRVLDPRRGRETGRITVPGSKPVSIAAFPDKPITAKDSYGRIVFGNGHGYYVKTWVHGRLPQTAGTITTSTVPVGEPVSDAMAVPLAVDPGGRSAIMTGPIDGTGKITGQAGRNVLWAYVCGDYGEGSPGNRVLKGHQSTVVSAAWSDEGSRAVTGDANGLIIEWNATTMQETHRRQFNGRVAALAVSHDGKRVAAYVVGKRGRVFVWNSADATKELEPIHTDVADFSGGQIVAGLSFAPGGERLAGCVGDRRWLGRLGELTGVVRVWRLAPTPADQPAPRPVYARRVSQAGSARFVVPTNNTVLTSASREGAIDLYDVDNGRMLSRIGLGEVSVRRLVLSADRQWLAIGQQAVDGPQGAAFDVVVRGAMLHPERGTIEACQQLFDLSRGAAVAAVMRNQRLELWDPEKPELVKAAAFDIRGIRFARFSRDGHLLAVVLPKALVLWRWKADQHDRIKVDRQLSALAFSPDGRFLAEGAADQREIRIRDLVSKDIIHRLSAPSGRLLHVSDLKFAQGGRVLIAADKRIHKAQAANRKTRPRILFWDLADGRLVHQLDVSGLPQSLQISPNELYLVAKVAGPGGVTLAGWRLDGKPVRDGAGPPAAGR